MNLIDTSRGECMKTFFKKLSDAITTAQSDDFASQNLSKLIQEESSLIFQSFEKGMQHIDDKKLKELEQEVILCQSTLSSMMENLDNQGDLSPAHNPLFKKVREYLIKQKIALTEVQKKITIAQKKQRK